MPVGGNALYLASNKLLYNSKEGLAKHFGINPDDILYKEGLFEFKNRYLSFSDLTKLINADKFLNVDQPSLFVINQLKDDLSKTHTYMQQWVIDESRPDEQFKIEAELMLDSIIKSDLDTIDQLSNKWISESGGLEEFKNISAEVSSLIESYNSEVRNVLVDVSSYQDGFSSLMAQTMFEEINASFEAILISITKLSQIRTHIADEQQIKTNERFSNLINNILLISIIIVIGTISIAIFTTISITQPVQRLKSILLSLGRGVFPKSQLKPSNDEIGEMSEAMNSLVKGLKETTDFAHEIGQSNFDYEYQPLSDEDVLGHALLKMKDELAETERILEEKVQARTEEVVKQKAEIEQKAELKKELNFCFFVFGEFCFLLFQIFTFCFCGRSLWEMEKSKKSKTEKSKN